MMEKSIMTIDLSNGFPLADVSPDDLCSGELAFLTRSLWRLMSFLSRCGPSFAFGIVSLFLGAVEVSPCILAGSKPSRTGLALRISTLSYACKYVCTRC